MGTFATRVAHDAHTMSRAELESEYDISITESGAVFDIIENKWFENINEWVLFIAEQERAADDEQYEHFINGSGKFKNYDD